MTDISNDRVVQRNIDIVRRILVEIWTEGNVDLADELIAEDAVDHDRQPGEENGLASFEEHVGYLRNAASDLVANIKRDAVEMVLTSGRPIAEVAGELRHGARARFLSPISQQGLVTTCKDPSALPDIISANLA